ncbi:MAG: dihydrolipoyl dehydrogenase [Spirochaetaceae bacterium]|nr:dihydrolipoyl dehydrogenase [Spirochaetaceae bacterium]
MNSEYDLIIVGGGPGGYNAAERAGHAGLKTLVVEKETLGGVCLNRGCIPTKTLLAAAKHYHIAKDSTDFGVNTAEVSMDWSKAYKRKEKTVRALVSGVKSKLKKNHVTVIEGKARFADRSTIEVNGESYTAAKIIIATGSKPFIPPIPGADSPAVLTSREILDIDHIPESLVVIGGGVIGLEFASLFSTLGTKVSIIEMLPEIVPSLDSDVAALLRQRLEKEVTFKLGARVEKIDGNTVSFTDSEGSGFINGEVILMSVGRRPVTDGIGLENIGLDINRGAIVVDEQMRTNLPGVWAIGDCNGKSLLAHSAYRMGEVAVADMQGKTDRMRYNAIPSVVYSLPEAAGVGMTEADAAKAGREVVTKKLPMQYSGRYLAEYGQEPGFGKIVIDVKTKVLLGVHLVGGLCSENIWGAAAMIEAEFRVDDIKELIFPHPTVSEIIRETIWEF